MLLVAACTTVSVGPIEVTEDFNKALTASVELKGETVEQYGRVHWFPASDAYEMSRDGQIYLNGVVVLLNTRLLFLEWQNGQYKIRDIIKYGDSADVRRRVWGAAERIVIETKYGTTDAFSFLSDNGIGMSRPRTNRALAFLRTIIPSSDAHRD